mgnify:CR=1 FL=1
MCDGLKSSEIGKSAAELVKEKSRARSRAYHIKNRDRQLYQFRARYEKQRDEVFSHFGGKCSCCGETEVLFLSIDHVNNDGNVRRQEKGNSYRRLYSWLIKNNFPAGYQLLCTNCNHGKHRNGGICPHQEGSTTRANARRPKWAEAPGSRDFLWV